MVSPREKPRTVLSWLGCLSEETRLRLLCLLQGEELGVADLCKVLQLPQSTVSRHLKVLADQDWIHGRRQGTANLYSMNLDELAPEAADLWLLTRSQVGEWATLAQDRLRLRQLRRQVGARSFFADAAEHWPALRSELYGDHFLVDALAGLMPRDWTVADLGCGTGEVALTLAREAAEVIGVDQSHEMLTRARAVAGEAPNLRLLQGDLGALPLADGSCDAALMLLVLSYLPRPDEALGEMVRILRPGGKAVLVDLLRHDREDFRRSMGQERSGFEQQELAGMLEQAGAVQAACSVVAPHPEAKGPALLVATAIKPLCGGEGA